MSGLPPHPFLFVGFAPPRGAARRAAFGQLRAAEQAGLSATLIWHEAPHRLAEMLADLAAVFGGLRDAAVARELTKRFEEVRRGSLDSLSTHYAQAAARGELTVVVGPAEIAETGSEDLDRQLRQALLTHSVKDAAALVAGAASLPEAHGLCARPGTVPPGTIAGAYFLRLSATSRTASLPLPTPFLGLSADLLGLALGLQTVVARHLAGAFLERTLHLVADAGRTILVHVALHP